MKMPKILDKLIPYRKKKYIKEGGTTCPYCGSNNICGQHMEVDSTGAWQEIHCDDCNKTWNDVYKMTDIEEVQL